MIAEDGVRGDFQDFSRELLLDRYREGTNRSVFATDIDHILFEFVSLLTHLLCDETEFSSLMCEDIRLLFVLLGDFRKLSILAVFFLDTCGYLFDDVVVVADVLLDLVCENIEVEDTIREGIQKFGIVRDDDTGFFVAHEKVREVGDTVGVEIIRRLVEKQKIRLLDKRGRKQEPRLLPTRKRPDDTVKGRVEMDDIEDIAYARVDIIRVAFVVLAEEIPHGEITILRQDRLVCGRYGEFLIDANFPIARLQDARDELKNSTLTSSVLTHNGDLRATAHGEIHIIEDVFIVVKFKLDTVKTDNRLIRVHAIVLKRQWEALYENRLVCKFCFEKT